MYSDIIYNVQFDSHYDKETGVLHVLDEMALSIEPRRSVTNGIDVILTLLEKKYRITDYYRLFLYGTDRVISEYIPDNNKFIYVSNDNPLVDREFSEKMEILYEKESLEEPKKISIKMFNDKVKRYGYTTSTHDGFKDRIIVSKGNFHHVTIPIDWIFEAPFNYIMEHINREMAELQKKHGIR